MHTSTEPTEAAGSHPRHRIDLAGIVAVAASLEMATAFAVLAKPTYVVHLVFGPECANGGIAQCLGIALVALAIACWPVGRHTSAPAVRALCIYNGFVALYLTGVRTVVGEGGALLWPAVLLHALVALVLVAKSSPHELSTLS